jgi:membrane protease YdiL (CAAX protease family)
MESSLALYLEPLILYVLLFLQTSAPAAAGAVEFINFSPFDELSRIILYTIPALALIWYLLLKSRRLKGLGIGLPGKKDLFSIALALPALLLIGLSVSFISPYFSKIPRGPIIIPPQGIFSWVILVFSSLSTGYLEESYFRFYLLSKNEEMGLNPLPAGVLSTLLFSICHVYEGPWGFLNAVLAGMVLAFVFFRYRSLHGLAIAHGAYNVLVYVLGAL